MEEESEVTITYETLFEILRREKERSELQKLDGSFFDNVLIYLKDKQTIIDKQGVDVFSREERKKSEEQLENVRKIIGELYGKREKKILGMAVDKSKNRSAIIDNSSFLPEEKALFDNVVSVLRGGRENILLNLLELKKPGAEGSNLERPEGKVEKTGGKDTKLVRFLSAIPRFVGRELEEYGPFDVEDIASLPIEIAGVLINKGRAEEISED